MFFTILDYYFGRSSGAIIRAIAVGPMYSPVDPPVSVIVQFKRMRNVNFKVQFYMPH